ncbi:MULTISPECIES: phytoene desaturase family protein [Microbacterium]|uniref:phytoene desaturase family protein n=1 Tax=Microbacterium TaxID=33882 RepID=UPI0010F8B129|nr:NAD(P)/FAD-dependent oxidoreductase [Microbacterium sp. 4NA327F11]MCK9919634.1 NAD(P)/FAD-dependent oxidoreductase [Microbacteriaceae bacterium K1510]
MTPTHDVVIIGGGHNALVAAAYLGRAGRSVVILERLAHLGGAAVSERPWAGVDASLSRYSYLVSLLPRRIVDDLGLRVELRRRRYSSYTPDPTDPSRGVLVDTQDAAATARSMTATTGDPEEASRYRDLLTRLAPLATAVFPTMTEPLPTAATVRARLGDDELWEQVTERPLGELVRASLLTDLMRGVALTDGLIGTSSWSDDPSLAQNRCFLYHVIGGGTGDWDVPVGGMGRVSSEMERAAREAGAEVRTRAEVTSVSPDGEVRCADGRVLRGRLVLSGVGAAVLADLVTAGGGEASAVSRPAGAQVKVNMLLRRLPRLRDTSVAPEAAFAGTFHVNERMSDLDAAHATARAGRVPDPLPAEIYCHSLTDPSILGPELRSAGAQTLTLFGLQVPHALVTGRDAAGARDEVQSAAIRSLNAVLDEPIEDCLWIAPDGSPCIEARTTDDLERSLGMVGGDIFHGPLSWPWLDDAPDAAPARWGVASGVDGVLLCGSSAVRGGAVSGIGGHNAAMAARELLEA